MTSPTNDSRVTDRFEDWAATFAPGLVVDARPPWLDGRVMVVESGPVEGVYTGTETQAHQVLAVESGVGRMTERDAHGRRLTFDSSFAPGQVFAATPDSLMENNRTWCDTSVRMVSVFLEPSQLASACRAADLDYADVEWIDRFATPDPVLSALARALADEAAADAPGGRIYAQTLVAALAAHLLRHHSVQQGRPDRITGGLPARRLARVVDLVQARIADGDLSLETLAAAAGLSPFHFARAFRQTTGQTPFAFVRGRRMDAAARLLCEYPQWSVLAVALAVGYQSPTSFATAFKNRWGATPSAYRRDRSR